MNETVEKINDSKKKPSRFKFIFPAACLFLIIAAMVFIIFTQRRKSDPVSEKIIRSWTAGKLHKDPNEITDEDYKSFDTFLLFVLELSDIRLLEEFTNLKQLGLASISFPKKEIPKWMKFLSKLGIYDINKRFSLDLGPLEKLSKLKILTIQSTPVSNLKPLRRLINLEALYLVDIRISNIEPLMSLKNLRELYIQNCENVNDEQIEDLQKTLPELKIYR